MNDAEESEIFLPELTVWASCAEWRSLLDLADNGAISHAILPEHIIQTGSPMTRKETELQFSFCCQLFFALLKKAPQASPLAVAKLLRPQRSYSPFEGPAFQMELASAQASRRRKSLKEEPIVAFKATSYGWQAMLNLVRWGLSETVIEAHEVLKEARAHDLFFGQEVDPVEGTIEKMASACVEECHALLAEIGAVVFSSTHSDEAIARQKRQQNGDLAKVLPFQQNLWPS